jgi:hypothetical protein
LPALPDAANYIGANGRVNIGQFDVKRLAQNGCVETSRVL